ncbi:MAG: NAD(P)-dependent dehydrogenase (short-subunit alcohol dehydrogenase family) [Akkermansiaceae bacterium]|jgi:NAD(P)-dependent dehydrogenase (short-subunit alcohol dehydrogenase family)
MRERKEVILVTGTRAPAGLEIVWRLHGEGYRVVTADSTPARLCRGLEIVEESFELSSPV